MNSGLQPLLHIVRPPSTSLKLTFLLKQMTQPNLTPHRVLLIAFLKHVHTQIKQTCLQTHLDV